MKRVLLVFGILAGLVALVAAAGALLPKGHIASRVARYQQPPEKIWEAITNVETMPAWRKDLKGIRRVPGRNAWVETSDFGDLPLEVVEAVPPRRLVLRITDPHLPFGGTWTYEVTPADGGSTLRITETGEVYNPFFRFLSRFVFGYTSTMETYLKHLGQKFGEEVTPQP